MKIKFDIIELPDKPTDEFTQRTEEREFPDEAVREDDLCTTCGFPKYPDCKNWCQGYELLQKRKNEK